MPLLFLLLSLLLLWLLLLLLALFPLDLKRGENVPVPSPKKGMDAGLSEIHGDGRKRQGGRELGKS